MNDYGERAAGIYTFGKQFTTRAASQAADTAGVAAARAAAWWRANKPVTPVGWMAWAGAALVALAGASTALVALSGMLLGLCWAGIVVYAILVTVSTVAAMFAGGAALLFAAACGGCGAALLAIAGYAYAASALYRRALASYHQWASGPAFGGARPAPPAPRQPVAAAAAGPARGLSPRPAAAASGAAAPATDAPSAPPAAAAPAAPEPARTPLRAPDAGAQTPTPVPSPIERSPSPPASSQVPASPYGLYTPAPSSGGKAKSPSGGSGSKGAAPRAAPADDQRTGSDQRRGGTGAGLSKNPRAAPSSPVHVSA